MRGFIIFIFLLIQAFSSRAYADNEKFAVYYSDQAPLASFGNYNLLVLDSRYHPSRH